MQLDIALGLCYFMSQPQVSDGAAGMADLGLELGLSGTCMVPKSPARLG